MEEGAAGGSPALQGGPPRPWNGPLPARRCMRPLWHSATPLPPNHSNSARTGPRICAPHSLHWVAKIWLLGRTPLAIFFSSIEMADPTTLHAVVFRIGALICAAPAGIVREILPRLPATRIPGVAEAIEGLVNVRGTLLTVLDGHVLLQQARRVEDEGAIVVLEVAGKRYGSGWGRCSTSSRSPNSPSPLGPSCRESIPGWCARLVCRTTGTSFCSTSQRSSRRSSAANHGGLPPDEHSGVARRNL